MIMLVLNIHDETRRSVEVAQREHFPFTLIMLLAAPMNLTKLLIITKDYSG